MNSSPFTLWSQATYKILRKAAASPAVLPETQEVSLLAQELKKRFPRDNLVLAGHLGLMTRVMLRLSEVEPPYNSKFPEKIIAKVNERVDQLDAFMADPATFIKNPDELMSLQKFCLVLFCELRRRERKYPDLYY